MNTRSFTDLTTAEILDRLRERWEIGSYATGVLGQLTESQDREDVLQMEIRTSSDAISNGTSPLSALLFGLTDDFWSGNPGRKTIICCHAPIGGHVVVYDSYSETGLQGSLQVLDLNESPPANSLFAKATTQRPCV